ncbi:MAG: hypothetical protein AB7G37_17435, partial [Solirubrobacteraceae bacterium]
ALDGLGGLAATAVPAVVDLGALLPALRSLTDGADHTVRVTAAPLRAAGTTAREARTAILRARPVLARVGDAARDAARVLSALRTLSAGLESRGAVRTALDAIIDQTLAINAYDDVGHRIRIRATVDRCSAPARRPVAGCTGGATSGARVRSPTRPRERGERREAALARRTLAGSPPSRELRRIANDPAYRPLLRRLAALRGIRRRGSSTERAPARGGDAPITVEGGLLPRPPEGERP